MALKGWWRSQERFLMCTTRAGWSSEEGRPWQPKAPSCAGNIHIERIERGLAAVTKIGETKGQRVTVACVDQSNRRIFHFLRFPARFFLLHSCFFSTLHLSHHVDASHLRLIGSASSALHINRLLPLVCPRCLSSETVRACLDSELFPCLTFDFFLFCGLDTCNF